MPSIKISEQDLTRPILSEINTDVVYVPGYSNIGPENIPTYCETLADFQAIFGSKPFIYESNEELSNDVTLAIKGESEKSFVYASEILNQGLPILFERVVADNVNNVAASVKFTNLGTPVTSGTNSDKTITFTAKYKGVYGNLIKIIARCISSDDNDIIYEITEEIQESVADVGYTATSLGIKAEKHVIDKLSFTETSDYYYKNIELNFVNISMETGGGDELLAQSTSVNKNLTNGKSKFTVAEFRTELGKATHYTKLQDKNEYSIKYFTSGSYPNVEYGSTIKSEIAQQLLSVAANRGDAIALIDFDNSEINESWVTKVLTLSFMNGIDDIGKYGAAFIPWGLYKTTSINTISKMLFPGSFAYLSCLARSGSKWSATAGVVRGNIPNMIQTSQIVTGAISDKLQGKDSISINCILNIKPTYGYCIWGARTLFKNPHDLVASSFLNIRSVTSDVKKKVYEIAKKLTFEPNNNIMWLNFKAGIEPTLEQMVSNNAISAYRITKVATNKRATVAAKIRLVAIEPVEDWDITIELTDSYTSVE